MNVIGLTVRQVRYENKSFWRNPFSAFFTFAFPLMFLVIFNLLFGHDTYRGFGPKVSTSTFYTPAIVAFSVITACYTNIAMTVTIARDHGILKRLRGTPLPTWGYLAGRILHAILIAALLVVIVVAFGRVFYDVDIPTTTLPAFIVSLTVGAATFCALGVAVSGLIPNAEAAPAVVNASILPLLFISDIFIPLENAPKWLVTFSNIFPIKHFAHAILTAFNPFTKGAGFVVTDLVVMAVWCAGGLAMALRFFTWEPRMG
ncbi:MAG: ABC transporter permease [Actinomycetota bacterium]|nr:ABC transporter permease [Actinomycetota bacterium]